MKHKSKSGIIAEKAYIKVKNIRRIQCVRKNAKKRLEILDGGYKGREGEFESKVLEFWKPYGIKPKKYWYQIYCDGKGGFDPRYIPDDMMEEKIYPYFNNILWGRAYADKCGYDKLFPNLIRPRTIVKNSCGRYYDGKQNVISREQAIQLCLKEERFILKCATFSSGGRDIIVFEKGEVTEEAVRKFFKDYGMNFIVQELVTQHDDLAKLNASSLNTLRIQTFYFKGKVHILSAQIRIGSDGARVDNYSSGGFACDVQPDGRLSERAVSKAQGWATVHPNGFAFKDVVVPGYAEIIKVVKKEASQLPQLNIIGWDFAVGKNGEPVFIELNITPETNQNGSGPTFGDLTEAVLKDVFIDKTLGDAFL